MSFRRNLIAGGKLIVVNLLAGILTAVFAWVFALFLIGVGSVVSAFAPVLLILYVLIYILAVLFIGGWVANVLFGWK